MIYFDLDQKLTPSTPSSVKNQATPQAFARFMQKTHTTQLPPPPFAENHRSSDRQDCKRPQQTRANTRQSQINASEKRESEKRESEKRESEKRESEKKASKKAEEEKAASKPTEQSLPPNPTLLKLTHPHTKQTTPSHQIISLSNSKPQQQLAQAMTHHILTQKTNGITTTTITTTTTDPTSFFHKLECQITRYDTHQQSFIIDIKSGPQATEMLTNQLKSLQLALEKALPGFEIHCSPPSLHIRRAKTLGKQVATKKRMETKMTTVQSVTKSS